MNDQHGLKSRNFTCEEYQIGSLLIFALVSVKLVVYNSLKIEVFLTIQSLKPNKSVLGN
jgi:hypothetical protein